MALTAFASEHADAAGWREVIGFVPGRP